MFGRVTTTEYDEFAFLPDNASESGLAWNGPPPVRRTSVDVGGGRQVSALVWGTGPPDMVLLHGGAQNAHTWDTVALALDRPLVAIDLPGHGHSGWRDDHDYSPPSLAADVATAMTSLAPGALLLVGMSLGGLTAFSLTADHPSLVQRLAVVDVTPGTDHAKAEPIVAFISGPERFASFQEILDRTVRYNPTRSESSLRRGVIHNARELPDGSWAWRWDPVRSWRRGGSRAGGPAGTEAADTAARDRPDFSPLWEAVDKVAVPLMLVRGGLSGVVGDEDVAELLRRQPGARVVVVDGAGHSVQGDRPVELARLLAGFADA
jgi:pimeloyl-ACP methyl ester carboxylesterase